MCLRYPDGQRHGQPHGRNLYLVRWSAARQRVRSVQRHAGASATGHQRRVRGNSTRLRVPGNRTTGWHGASDLDRFPQPAAAEFTDLILFRCDPDGFRFDVSE